MEGADQVLALRCVDAGLAADRAVDLGQQAGRDLHEVEAAQGDSGGKAGEVADHAAAQRHQRCRALDLAIDELADQPTELVEASLATGTGKAAWRERVWQD